jgi:fructan beta-fructosidase
VNWKDEKHPIHDSFECPDFFELPLDGDKRRARWVLIQGSGKYSVGSFDGSEFKEDTERRVCDIGDFYATQTWGNVETGDGRRIQAAWVRFSHFPDMPFSQQVSFPCELTLHGTAQGPRLYRQPISEIASLHRGEDAWTNQLLVAGHVLPLEPDGRLFHLRANIEIPEGAKLTFLIRGIPVVIASHTLDSGHRHGTVEEVVKTIEILVDRTSIEIFLNHGELSCTSFVLPKENGLFLKAEGGAVKIHSIQVWRMSSAWPGAIPD